MPQPGVPPCGLCKCFKEESGGEAFAEREVQGVCRDHHLAVVPERLVVHRIRHLYQAAKLALRRGPVMGRIEGNRHLSSARRFELYHTTRGSTNSDW